MHMQEGQEYGGYRQAGEPGPQSDQPATRPSAWEPSAGGTPPPQPAGNPPAWAPSGAAPPAGPAGGPPPAGHPGGGPGWGSAGGPPYGPLGTGWQAQPPRRRRGRQALTYVLVAALAAGTGAGTALALHHGSAASSSATGISTAQIPQPNPNASPGASTVNAQAVANKVIPGLVDINTVIAFQNVPAAATAMVLSPTGLALTNNHVVEDGTHLTATTVSGVKHTYKVKVLGVDPSDDVALIRLQGAAGLKTIQVGDSAKVQLGMGVVAIGNAGGRGGTPSVTTGTITSLNRTIMASDGGSGSNSETLHGMLQTNAPIQPGDSGGAWANSAGEVIGMTTAANSQTLGSAGTSMGFAVPINKALSIAREIAAGHESQKILIGSGGFIGVGVANPSDASQCLAGSGFGGTGGSGGAAPTQSGALVCASYPRTPAAKAGLAAGDVIVSVNGEPVTSANSLSTIMRRYHPADKVSLTWVDTNGQRHSATITLAAGPAK
jgi:S1-C subfamily serine protease